MMRMMRMMRMMMRRRRRSDDNDGEEMRMMMSVRNLMNRLLINRAKAKRSSLTQSLALRMTLTHDKVGMNVSVNQSRNQALAQLAMPLRNHQARNRVKVHRVLPMNLPVKVSKARNILRQNSLITQCRPQLCKLGGQVLGSD